MRKTVLTMQCGETAIEKVVPMSEFRTMKEHSEAGFSYGLALPECNSNPDCLIVCWEGESPDFHGMVQLREYKFNCSKEKYLEYLQEVFDWRLS